MKDSVSISDFDFSGARRAGTPRRQPPTPWINRHWRFARNTLFESISYYAIPDGKPLRTFPGIAPGNDRIGIAMADVTKDQVLEQLKTVTGPDFNSNIVDLGLVSDIFIADSKVFFSITVPAARAQELEPLRAAAERVVKSMPGVAGAVVALTAEKKGGPTSDDAPPRSVPSPRPTQRPAPAGAVPPPRVPAQGAPAQAARRRRTAMDTATAPRSKPGFPASRPSLRLPQARAVSASRPRPSTSLWGCRPMATGSAFSMRIFTGPRCHDCWVSMASRKSSPAGC